MNIVTMLKVSIQKLIQMVAVAAIKRPATAPKFEVMLKCTFLVSCVCGTNTMRKPDWISENIFEFWKMKTSVENRCWHIVWAQVLKTCFDIFFDFCFWNLWFTCFVFWVEEFSRFIWKLFERFFQNRSKHVFMLVARTQGGNLTVSRVFVCWMDHLLLLCIFTAVVDDVLFLFFLVSTHSWLVFLSLLAICSRCWKAVRYNEWYRPREKHIANDTAAT